MITITILGLDPYLLKQLSREMNKNLVSLYECGEDGIDFFAPEGLLVHNGVDQTSWNVEIRVHAPLKVKVLEKQAFEVIKGGLGNFCVNAVVIFEYYSQDNRYEVIRDEYPRYMSEKMREEEEYRYDNEEIVEDTCESDECNDSCCCGECSDDECCCDDDCCLHDHEHHDCCSNHDDEPYLGNAFEDFEKRMGGK